jgi:hypothetical protein
MNTKPKPCGEAAVSAQEGIVTISTMYGAVTLTPDLARALAVELPKAAAQAEPVGYAWLGRRASRPQYLS